MAPGHHEPKEVESYATALVSPLPMQDACQHPPLVAFIKLLQLNTMVRQKDPSRAIRGVVLLRGCYIFF